MSYYTGTKRQIAQSVLGYLSNWDIQADQAVDIREVYIVLDRVSNKYAKLGLFENMQSGDKNVGASYLTTFPQVPIVYDPVQMLCYSVLPSRYLNLPFGKGIDAVWPSSERSATLKPVPRGFLSSFRNSPTKQLQGNDGYWVEGNLMYYTKRYDGSGVVDVFIRLVISDSSAIDEDATYPIDPAMEKTIIDEVIAYFMPNEMRPQDTVADNRRTDQ